MKTPTLVTTLPESAKAMQVIKETVAKEFGITVAVLESNARQEPLPMIRHVAMSLCYELVEFITLQGIASSFKRSEHQSIIHAIQATKTRCDISPAFKRRVDSVRVEAEALIQKGFK